MTTEGFKNDLISFLREIIAVHSPSRKERAVLARIEREMEACGWEDVRLDGMGNLIGRIGGGDSGNIPAIVQVRRHIRFINKTPFIGGSVVAPDLDRPLHAVGAGMTAGSGSIFIPTHQGNGPAFRHINKGVTGPGRRRKGRVLLRPLPRGAIIDPGV